MFANLRHAIARAIAPKAPPPAVVPATPKRRYPHLARALLAQAKAGPQADNTYTHPKRPEGNELGKFPELAPGVVPKALPASTMALDAADYTLGMDIVLPGETKRTAVAMDGNPFAPSWGFTGGSSFGNGFWFPGYPYLAELTQISEYRAPCETISTEMTRKWFEIQSREGATKKPDDEAEAEGQTDKGDKSDKIAQIMARFEELKVRELFKRAALLDAEFGRAQIYLNIDDADERVRQLPLELTPESIKKGSLKSIACIEPYWSTPYSWNSMYPERSDFYKPTSWYVMGRKTHSTRLLTFIGREVPDLLKPAYNFSGISMIQLGELTVNMWLRTRKAVNDLINNFSIPVLHTDLAATLEDGAEEGSGLMPRLQAFTLTRNNQSIAAINKDTELLEFAEATLASLDKLQAQSQEHMAAVWKLPLIKIFGLAPAGLGATGEGEIQVHYDNINSLQINFYGPHLDVILKVVQLDLFGAIDDDLVVHWITLDEPTQKELSEIRKSDSDMDASNINSGIISPEEARDRLKSDPESGYSNLTGPPPEPEQIDPETGEPVAGSENGGTEPEGEAGNSDDDSELQGFALDESKFEESKHKRGPGGQFGSGGHAAADPHTTAGGAKTEVNPPAQSKGTVTTTKEYRFAGQPDDPGHERVASALDPKKIKATQAGSEKVASLMSGAEKKPDAYSAVKPVAANEKSPRAQQGGASKAPFVNAFMSEHKNREDDIQRLSKLPDEKLNKAYSLLKNINDEDAKYMKELIREVLKSSK
jgi:phage-related protein (TIGR01555 family)